MNGAADFQRLVNKTDVKNPSMISDPPDGEVPYRPWARARQQQQEREYEHPTKPEHIDPQNRCLMPGVPRAYYNSPVKVIQSPGQVALVIDATNLNAKNRLSYIGDFFSENAHLVERLNFTGATTMTYEVTVDDPTVFTRPWTIRVPSKRVAEDEMWEWAYHEGERSVEKMLSDGQAGNK